jgi:hypothetical protein
MIVIQAAQMREASGNTALPVDQVRLGLLRKADTDQRRVRQQDIEKLPTRWRIGTEPAGIGGEQRVRRADRKGTSAACAERRRAFR